jgi:hypothetical protein
MGQGAKHMELNKKRTPKKFIKVKSRYDIIKNTPVFMAAAIQYNYDAARMKEGEDLIFKAEELCYEQQKKYNDSYEATKEFNKTVEEMKTIYTKHVKIAGIFLYSNKQKQIDLGISSPKSLAYENFSNQYCHFYREVEEDPELLRRFESYNVAQMDMKQALSLLAKAEQNKDKQLELIEKAREATKQRDIAIKAAQRWCGDLSALASLPQNGDICRSD